MPTEITLSNAKMIAKSLRSALADSGFEIKHSESLHILSKAFGYKNWNTLQAILERPKTRLPQKLPLSRDEVDALLKAIENA